MFDGIDYTKVIKRALSGGGEFADIYLERSYTTSIVCEDDKIERVISGVDIGAGIRVIRNLKTLYAFTNDLDEKAVLNIAGTVSSTYPAEDREITLNLKKLSPDNKCIVKLPPDKIKTDEKVSYVTRANNYARKKDPSICQARVVLNAMVKQILTANSQDEIAEQEIIRTVFFVHVVVGTDGDLQTGYEAYGGTLGFELFEDTSPEEIADIAASRALLMLKSPRAKGGKMPVVLGSNAGGTMIHEAVGHGLEADLAQQGLSVYSGKINEKIASPLITVIDDPTIPQKNGSYSFDDEGVQSRSIILVEKGILKGYLYDRLTAMKDNTDSTGNGRRESYRFRPIPRMSNTYIASGDTLPQDIVKSVDRGLYVEKMGGGQVNTVNGDFVFEVSEGYIIDKGEIGHAVRGATISGNGPKILQEIDMVGNDLGFGIGTCGKDGQGTPVADAQPTLHIPEIIVGGAAT
ncbi:MAG: TldD/PmbA family protein [Thermodesulfobacteriota bacterium]|nr:TldD/PmbA family protein [Thermodesulfobacteriota bacterium]